MRTLTARCVATFAILDILFNPLVVAAFLPLLGIGQSTGPVLVLVGAVALKLVANSIYISAVLRPHERHALSTNKEAGTALLLAADRALQAFPRRVAIFYSFSWSLCYGLGYLAVRAMFPELELSSGANYAVLLVCVAVWFGGFAFGLPVASILSSGASGECSVIARKHRVPLERTPGSLQVRIGIIAFALGVGPTLWMISLGYMKQKEAWDEVAVQRADVGASNLAFLVAKAPGDWGHIESELAAARGSEQGDVFFLVGPDASLLTDGEQARQVFAIGANDGGLRAELSKQKNRGNVAIDGGRLAYARLGDGSYAMAYVPSTDDAVAGFILSSIVFALLVGLWAPVSAVALGRAVSSPLLRLTSAAREIVEQGRQSEMKSLPVARNDEVGTLSNQFNDLIDLMRDLSTAADAIAGGDLDVEVDRRGELPDAFRRMTESLRQMVAQIRETAVDLASATTEIFAASQEQEAAATSQSSAMEEISRTMDSLSESAAHVSDAVQGVLANAEKTLENTDEMVSRITELSAHASRIGEILEVIREIADRSDLLALNGSLEASRAGEGGQGFALVAGEMRRLAERVTASVEDIKRLVSDIRDSGSSTVMATEESRRLAQGTTEAARQITFVTQQQRSGTEQVSHSVKNITEIVTQAVTATSQTRTSAEGLKQQADNLTQLLKRFELEQHPQVQQPEAAE